MTVPAGSIFKRASSLSWIYSASFSESVNTSGRSILYPTVMSPFPLMIASWVMVCIGNMSARSVALSVTCTSSLRIYNIAMRRANKQMTTAVRMISVTIGWSV